MLSSTMQNALNAQINKEQYSSQLYLAMSAHLDARKYMGFAHWLRIQSEEESAHAMKLVDFVLEQCATLELKPIAAPPVPFDGVIQLFELALEHEKENTASIHSLFETARTEKDYASADDYPADCFGILVVKRAYGAKAGDRVLEATVNGTPEPRPDDPVASCLLAALGRTAALARFGTYAAKDFPALRTAVAGCSGAR